MYRKRLLFLAVFLLTIIFGTNIGKAEQFNDVNSNYWANREIEKCVYSGYLKLDSNGNFNPEGTISRVDFVTALLKVLRNDNIKIVENSSFKDVNSNTRGEHSILTSKQLRMIYGYPDRTFKPENPVTRSESTSVIANITKNFRANTSVLNRFYDEDKIPRWARALYAKNVQNDLYVNYPDADMLRPNDKLTKAEAAVLLAKISSNLELIESKYLSKKKIDGIHLHNEHLSVYSKAPRNVVEIWNVKMLADAGNVFPARFDGNFNSRLQTVNVGDPVNFMVTRNVSTDEGTLILPAYTRLNARIIAIKTTKWKNKNDKALVVVDNATLPNGSILPMAGVPLTKRGKLVPVEQKPKKTFWYPREDKKENKGNFYVNYSRILSPVIKYDNLTGDRVYILLTGDMPIPYNEL